MKTTTEKQKQKQMQSDLAQKLANELDLLCSKNSPMPLRQWVFGNEGKVFVRVTCRALGTTTLTPTIDLSSVEIDEEFQNQGVFKDVLRVVESKAQQYDRHVFVENVINSVLLNPLNKYGYIQIGDEIPSFSKAPSPIMKPKYK